MELANLKNHIRTLAFLEETDSPVISCYLNLEKGEPGYRKVLDERVRALRKSLTGQARRDFEEALGPIEAFIETELLPTAKGTAIFARAGASPFFLPLQFRVPLPDWIIVNSTPNIYHLVELKDTYDRYVLMIATKESVRIVEVNLGSVTEELWRERPELRRRVGREWSKEHYQNHRRDRTDQFIKEQISVLEQEMRAGGHTHLILAGNPQITSRVREALPKRLSARLIDTVVASRDDRISDVVMATLSSFVEQEEMESLAMVDKLQQEIKTSGLAVAGTYASLRSLKRKQVDVIVMARTYEPDPGWSCAACGAVEINRERLRLCSECGEERMREFDVKEEMVRLAEQNGCGVEVVNHSEILMEFGGVGALLRYHGPEHYQ